MKHIIEHKNAKNTKIIYDPPSDHCAAPFDSDPSSLQTAYGADFTYLGSFAAFKTNAFEKILWCTLSLMF